MPSFNKSYRVLGTRIKLPLCVNFNHLRRTGKEIFVQGLLELTKKPKSGGQERKEEKLELRAKLKSVKLI